MFYRSKRLIEQAVEPNLPWLNVISLSLARHNKGLILSREINGWIFRIVDLVGEYLNCVLQAVSLVSSKPVARRCSLHSRKSEHMVEYNAVQRIEKRWPSEFTVP